MALYSISSNNVTVYKHALNSIWQLVITNVIIAVVVYFFMEAIPHEYRIAIAVALLAAIPFIYFVQKAISISFSADSQTVYINYPVIGRFKLISFSEIAHIGFVSESNNFTAFKPVGGHYRIATKADPFGKGIKLLLDVDTNSQQVADFCNFALPAIDTMLNAGQPAQATPLISRLDSKFITEKADGLYTFRHYRWLANILWLALLGVGVLLTVNYINEGFTEWVDYAAVLLCVVLPVVSLYRNARIFVFDMQAKTLTVEYPGGLFKKEYNLFEFAGFYTVRNKHNGIYMGTELFMQFTGKPNVKLGDFYSTKRLNTAVQELEALLKGNFI